MAASKSMGGISFGVSFLLGILAFVFSFVPYWFSVGTSAYKISYSIFIACTESYGSFDCSSVGTSAYDSLFDVARAAGGIGILLGIISFILHMVWLCSCCSPTPSRGVTVGAAACVLCQGICGVLAVVFFIAHFQDTWVDLLGVSIADGIAYACWVYLVISVLLMVVGSIFVHITRRATDSPETQGVVLGQYPQGQVQQPQGYPNQQYAGQAAPAQGMPY